MLTGRSAATGLALLALATAPSGGCRDKSRPDAAPTAAPARPSILLVTLDTTRADAIGPEAKGVRTPAFDALASRGRLFRQAYATAPETLPSHASMLTGLYPAGHGVHENARVVRASHATAAERLQQAGYATAAFVSAFVLERRFGLARGFALYDDQWPRGRVERSARETTDRALAFLAREPHRPLFVWVHYFDPHHPYEPPEPYRSRHEDAPYLGEVAAMDEQLGRLVEGFERATGGAAAIVVAGDHGEGLGEHGEAQHGRLLYQATMRVPLVIAGPAVAAGTSDEPVSARRVFDTLLDFAGLGAQSSLRGAPRELVLGEAMKPYLSYGWQPQVMAVEPGRKAILAGRLEAYDLSQDPGERQDAAETLPLSRELRNALRDYPAPSLQPPPDAALGEEERRQLASLGYVAAGAQPLVRRDAPRPVDMASLFAALDEASTLFVREQYARAIPLLQRILAADPWNLDAALRLATAHSSLGQDQQALALFERAGQIAPTSPDVRVYLGLHYARGADWPRAVPLLERAVAESPDRLPALEALAGLCERQGRAADAVALLQRVHALRRPSAAELARLGALAMAAGQTPAAIGAFEAERAQSGASFAHDLELGVLYLAARRFEDARAALDRVPAAHPGYPMALFKRAQVSVLLAEPDSRERIALARRRADATTRPLIERERLFQRAP
jgi:arylsulfatase A-like enzyme/Tfp pilus assembly protein PilF